MLELISLAIQPVNLPYTVVLGLILLYWLSVILGVFNIFSFDFDFDPVDTLAGIGSVLAWLNLGEVPLMLFASIASVSSWAISISANYLLGNSSGQIAGLLVIPNLVISCWIAKLITSPFKLFFRKQDGFNPEAIGSLCILRDDAIGNRLAEGSVETGGASLILNVRTRDGQFLPKGTQVLVIERDTREPERDIYIVEAFEDWQR